MPLRHSLGMWWWLSIKSGGLRDDIMKLEEVTRKYEEVVSIALVFPAEDAM